MGGGSFWSPDMWDYYIKFIQGAGRYHGLDITSVGGKNERGYDRAWYVGFRKALDANRLRNVKLVGSDGWGPYWIKIVNESAADPALDKAVNVFAGHLTWSENPPVPSDATLKTGKPVWDTDLHNYRAGFDAEISLVEAFNLNYIRDKVTKDMVWNLLWAYYPVSSYPDVGMIRATSPWSGHYEVLPVLWGYAHVNQFVKPGWRFLEKGGNGLLPGGGNYTCLESPAGGDYSLLLQTKGAAAAQTVRFRTANGLSPKALHVWESTARSQFLSVRSVAPRSGAFTLTLAPDCVYSVTTTTGQHKGGYPEPPADFDLKLPYADDYQNYAVGTRARYHFDYGGAFEVADKTVGAGKCLRQAATRSSSGWGGAFLPLTFLGSDRWKDYTVSADAYIEGAGAVSLHGRINTIPNDNSEDPPGYTLRVRDTGAWELKSFKTVLATGTTPFSADHWHALTLSFRGSTVTGSADGRPLFRVLDTTYAAGLVGLGSGWNFAQYSNLKIVPNAGPTAE